MLDVPATKTAHKSRKNIVKSDPKEVEQMENVTYTDKTSRATGFKVAKGVALPPTQGGGGKAKYPWAELGAGDSFFVPNGKVETFYTLTSSARKKFGKQFVARKVSDGAPWGFSGSAGVGVWCIET